MIKDRTLKSPDRLWLMLLCTLLVASGASCPHTAWQPFKPSAPVVFNNGEPSLEEVAQVINANRAKMTGLYSTNSRISGTDFPSLRTSLAVAGERNVRMRAGTGVTGQEMDVGSNQEVFWFWIKRADPPALYYGRYDEHPAARVGGGLPIRPEWLTEAIGLVSLPPHQEHQGPFRRNDGLLEIRSPLVGPTGPMTRVLVLDAKSGWIRELQLIDAQGQLVAAARNSDHFRDPESGAVLPRTTEIEWPAAGMQLTLRLGDVQIGPLDPASDMWSQPQYPGFPNIRVTEPGPVQSSPVQSSPVQSSPVPPNGTANLNQQRATLTKDALVANISTINTQPVEESLWRTASGNARLPAPQRISSKTGSQQTAIRAQDGPLVLPSSRSDAAAKAFGGRIRSDSRRHGAVFHGRD